mmetsp:Transcript_134379/g.218698  ORF Transcript_134379/g.218698 Transcript_134379/m.218698 type:complete len:206 (+) Transcript_134379:59-676(+)
MRAVALALTCLACVSNGRRILPGTLQASDTMKSLAMLLQAADSGAAWQVAPTGTRQAFAKKSSQSRTSQSDVAMSAVVDEVMEKLKSMSLVEASELVKAIEETFDVDASAAGGGMPMMMAAPGAAAGEAEEAAPEKTEFNVVLDGFAEGKLITTLKTVRELTGLGLKEAKTLTQNGGVVKEEVSKADAEEAAKKLEAAGANVKIE